MDQTTGETNLSAGAGYLHIAWKKCRLAGSPILTGVTKLTAYHRFVSDTPPTPCSNCLQIRARPLVAVSQGCPFDPWKL